MLKSMRTVMNVRLVLLIAILISCGASWAWAQTAQNTSVEKAALRSLENGFASIADQVGPAVVSIRSEKVDQATSDSNESDFFFGWPFGGQSPFGRGNPAQRPSRREVAMGSGIIIRPDGYVLTNEHVVAGFDIVTVTLKDGREFRGSKVLHDEIGDIALIKIEAAGLPAARLGDSDKVRVGQWAIAVGAPFNLSQTLTVGVISAVQRDFAVPGDSEEDAKYYPEMLQTDAAINRGNSGGPLLNIDGEVIGINTAIESPSGGNVGVGFAIPSSLAKWSVDQLIAKGKVVRGYLGLQLDDVSPSMAEVLGVKQGAVITSIEKDSPADKAGIQAKDVVVKFGDKPVTGQLQLRRLAAATPPGTKVPVVVVRDKKQQTLTVTTGERSKDMPGSPEKAKTKIGIEVEELTSDKAESLGIDPKTNGVLVSSVDRSSPAAMAGMRPKDLILEVNNKKTPTVATFDDAVSELKSGDMAIMIVRRGNRTSMVSFNID